MSGFCADQTKRLKVFFVHPLDFRNEDIDGMWQNESHMFTLDFTRAHRPVRARRKRRWRAWFYVERRLAFKEPSAATMLLDIDSRNHIHIPAQKIWIQSE